MIVNCNSKHLTAYALVAYLLPAVCGLSACRAKGASGGAHTAPSDGVAENIHIDITPSHVKNTFSPLQALGTSVDRVPSNATDAFFEPNAIEQDLSAGWGAITYRQNTELFCQAWHWNPKGTWSDPSGKGYFTGDATPTSEPIRHSYGYSLPHRGVTRNEGTEFDGYSRLSDGDLETYWKSNPYLSKPYTGEPECAHPGWIAIDLDKQQPIDAIRIAWAEPYARLYEVQYWTGENAACDLRAARRRLEDVRLRTRSPTRRAAWRRSSYRPSPVRTRWARILMTESSNTCDSHGSS